MSIIKNTKIKEKSIDKMIKQILNIKDSTLSFSKDAVSKQKVKGRMCTAFTGVLTYHPPHCEHCGFVTRLKKAGFSCFLIKKYLLTYAFSNNDSIVKNVTILFQRKPIM